MPPGIEPQLGDVVYCPLRRPGYIDRISYHEGIILVRVKYENTKPRDFYTMSQLTWENGRWVVKQ
jgi:hypothetical protein